MIEMMIHEDSKSLFNEKFKLTRLELRNKVHLSV